LPWGFLAKEQTLYSYFMLKNNLLRKFSARLLSRRYHFCDFFFQVRHPRCVENAKI